MSKCLLRSLGVWSGSHSLGVEEAHAAWGSDGPSGTDAFVCCSLLLPPVRSPILVSHYPPLPSYSPGLSSIGSGALCSSGSCNECAVCVGREERPSLLPVSFLNRSPPPPPPIRLRSASGLMDEGQQKFPLSPSPPPPCFLTEFASHFSGSPCLRTLHARSRLLN